MDDVACEFACGVTTRRSNGANVLKQNLAKNISLQRSIRHILGLTVTVALLANEARFFRFRVFFRGMFFPNEVGDPPFFKPF